VVTFLHVLNKLELLSVSNFFHFCPIFVLRLSGVTFLPVLNKLEHLSVSKFFQFCPIFAVRLGGATFCLS